MLEKVGLMDVKLVGLCKFDGVPTIRVRGGGNIRLDRVSIRAPVVLFADGGEILVGSGAFFNRGCSITSLDKVEVGSRVHFGEGVRVYDHDHVYTSSYALSPGKYNTSQISIGDECWLGSSCILLRRSRLTSRVIIAAGSVVREQVGSAGVYSSRTHRLQRIK